MPGHRIGDVRVVGINIPPVSWRPLLAFVRAGDTVVVHSMERFARNLDDLRYLVQDLMPRGITGEFMHEYLVFTGQDSPRAHLMQSVMAVFAEFERDLLRERQREGIALAKQRGGLPQPPGGGARNAKSASLALAARRSIRIGAGDSVADALSLFR